MNYNYQWLNWTKPILHEAADYLCQQYAGASSSSHTWDMTDVIVVVPGNRAGRRLLELLVERAEQRELQLVPPRIVTLGVLPELLYQPRKPFADLLTQQLAWGQALRELRIRLTPVFSRLPDSDEPLAWRDLGDLLRREHTELAADLLDFEQVAAAVEPLGGPHEKARWKVLHQVQVRYLEILDELGLWDLQTARLYALKHHEFQTASKLVLVGTVDMNGTQRKILDQVAPQVTVLIHAPREWEDRFDTHGCLRADAWHGVPLDLRDEQLSMVGGAEEQLAAIVQRINDFHGQFRADEISIGIPAETLVPEVERKLAAAQLPARYGPGRPISETSPYRLLTAIAEYQQGRSYHDFAALVRHPDLTAWLNMHGITGDWLTPLDRYYNRTLPTELSTAVVNDQLSDHDSSDTRMVARLVQIINLLLSDLNEQRRALVDWIAIWRRVLWRVYGEREYDLTDDSQRRNLRACESLIEALDDIRSVPATLLGEATAQEALELAFTLGGSTRIPAPTDQPAIELLGWLELALDDAPALIVVGLNDGVVPESVNADPFLPNRLRTQLKLDDNARRYARDAYALSVLIATRSELHLIVGRQDLEGNPQAPSRLLFACDRHKIAERMLRWCSGESSNEQSSHATNSNADCMLTHSEFPLPMPEDVAERLPRKRDREKLELNVTDFKRYQDCPYRFFLERWGGLQLIGDDVEELDGRGFGNLAHEVLERFGLGPCRDSDNAEQITAFLVEELHRVVRSQYGRQPRPAIRVQVERLQRRLQAFARKQAEWFVSGWRIHYVEQRGVKQHITLPLDQGTFTLIGRIDRIDFHSSSNQYAVLDYKTGDEVQSPKKTHLKDKRWVDFQLPLYRHLVKSMGISTTVRLGYIVLPKDVDKSGVQLAEWTESELTEADTIAWQIARNIRDFRFNEMNDNIPAKFDDFRRVVQAGVLKHE